MLAKSLQSLFEELFAVQLINAGSLLSTSRQVLPLYFPIPRYKSKKLPSYFIYWISLLLLSGSLLEIISRAFYLYTTSLLNYFLTQSICQGLNLYRYNHVLYLNLPTLKYSFIKVSSFLSLQHFLIFLHFSIKFRF